MMPPSCHFWRLNVKFKSYDSLRILDEGRTNEHGHENSGVILRWKMGCLGLEDTTIQSKSQNKGKRKGGCSDFLLLSALQSNVSIIGIESTWHGVAWQGRSFNQLVVGETEEEEREHRACFSLL